MLSLLDSIIDAQESRGAIVVSEEHDTNNIIPAGPAGDPNEYAPTKERAMQRASLDTSAGRVALMSAGRVLPWHGLGVVVDKATTSAEAIRFASLDWRVAKVPMQ